MKRAGGGLVRLGDKKASRSRYNVDNSAKGKLERTYLGVVYASKAEKAYAMRLELLKKSKVIRDWYRVTEHFDIGAGLKYTPDFVVTYTTKPTEIHEVKGAWTRDAKMRVKLFRAKYPDSILRVFMAKKERRSGYEFVEEKERRG